MNRSKTFKFRCTSQEIGRWGRLAGKENMKLSAWIRKQCNGESALAAKGGKKNGKV